MKNLLLCICFIFNVCCLYAQSSQKALRPKLVVGVVIDQMRWDYLYKYYDRYSDNGFKKLMDDGFNCQNTMINYLPSFTGPGHASVYTGSVPAIHGIVANDWVNHKTHSFIYCTEDKNVAVVAGSTKAGKMSPQNMFTTTITDELKIATQRKAKVFGIGLKDRGSILPAGHSADAAFWFDDSTGNFITSSYYMSELPEWMVTFNNKRYADSIMHTQWTTLYPISSYHNSTVDNTEYEGLLQGEKSPVFPHKTPEVKGKGYYGVRYVPGGNTITLKAAKACMTGEQLGKDNITDFLCVTLSTTDYAGHNYGPDAVEIEDMYLRLDLELAQLLQYLDKNVGENNYTLFLTADHGAAHNAKYMQDLKIPVGTETQVNATNNLNDFLKKKTGKDSLILAMYNYQVYINENRVKQAGLDRAILKADIIAWLSSQAGVGYVVDLEQMGNAMIPHPLKDMIINGYYKDRSGSIQIVMQPGWYSGSHKTGTTHGGWHPYDTHIPLLWYGWGIQQGQTYKTVHITDIAPTLAALLHIQMPNGCIGSVITEVLK